MFFSFFSFFSFLFCFFVHSLSFLCRVQMRDFILQEARDKQTELKTKAEQDYTKEVRSCNSRFSPSFWFRVLFFCFFRQRGLISQRGIEKLTHEHELRIKNLHIRQKMSVLPFLLCGLCDQNLRFAPLFSVLIQPRSMQLVWI